MRRNAKKSREPGPRSRGPQETRAAARAASGIACKSSVPAHSLSKGAPAQGTKDEYRWLLAALLVVVVFLVYQPAWHGGPIWDDEHHMTRPEMRSWYGLYRTWFDVGATLQYYPLVHSVFWIEHRLWGDAMLGYHLVNIFLHCTAAVMVATILRRLAVPGAYLAAAIFALHPVQVESVAWITELKNTLSGVFYFGAAMLYLRFDQTRAPRWYVAALGVFLLALLTKTVTGTLPGALLVIFWWQRGRLSWTKDVLPLVPLFLLGAGMGIVTAWWELKINHCDGPAFQFSRIERVLIAGRGVWFHLRTLFWPARLAFIYPRWEIDAGDWRQYFYPLGSAALLAAAWAMRKRTRAPLAALLFFGGTLFPVMGFFNLYTYQYSFVANHYQYLACLGIIVLFSAGAALLQRRLQHRGRAMARAGCAALLAVLAFLTWKETFLYADAETLYKGTLTRNPACWMAHNNLGAMLADRGRNTEAIAEYEAALEINPDLPVSNCNVGIALVKCGRVDAAIPHYRKALELDSDFAEARFDLGFALVDKGQIDEAILQYRKGLEAKPDCAEAHNYLALILAGRGRVDEAVTHYLKALEINPDYAKARLDLGIDRNLAAPYHNLGLALAKCGRVDEAIAHFRKALELKPDFVEARYNLGLALAGSGQNEEAIVQFRKALEARPDYAEAHNSLALALCGNGRVDEAIAHYRKALEVKPGYAKAHVNLGIALAGRGQTGEAIAHYRKALEIEPNLAEAHYNLGVDLAGRGHIDEAIAEYRKALQIKPGYAAAQRNLNAVLSGRGK